MLSAEGLSFQATGYLPPPTALASHKTLPETRDKTIPMAAWITFRYEDQGSDGASDLFLPKVELISGGRIGKGWSYFIEWRIVSESLNSDGTFNDRSGRFEDLFAEWRSDSNRNAVKLGQYRSLNQIDVSLRLSPSEPLLFKNGLSTGSDPDPRLDALDSFSPSARSPSIGYSYQSIKGERASDGLFHFVTVPFVGEFSIPLSQEASENASFELGEAKGLYAETFFRRGLKSIGGNAFYGGDDAWLITVLGTWDWRGLVLTAGVGLDDEKDRDRRERGSVQGEYLMLQSKRYRGAVGLRVEDVSDDGSHATYVPYAIVSAPTSRYTFLLQVEYKSRDGSDVFVADLSALF